MARRRLLSAAVRDVGATLLTPKLQILKGTGNRRPSIALSILTGRVAEQLSILENFYSADPVVAEEQLHLVPPLPEPSVQSNKAQLVARTVYLSEDHLRDIDALIALFGTQQVQARRVTRSAVLRRALQHLRDAVEADPAKSFLENV